MPPAVTIRRRPLLEQYLLGEREQKNLVILEMIRRRGPVTRSEISQGTNLNIVTVSNYISSYLKRGLVIERGLDESTGGRRPVLIELNAKAALAIGVDLGTMDVPSVEMVAVLTDLAGKVLHRAALRRPKESIEAVLAHASVLVHTLLQESGADRDLLAGIGIGVAGVIDEAAGTVRDTSRGGIRTNFLGVRDALEAEYGRPVFLGNDATLAAVGELSLGLDTSVRNLIYMYADVGCGIIMHDAIYWGAGGSAGEFGINRPTEDDALTWERNGGYLRPAGVDLGIPATAKKLIGEGLETAITRLAGSAEAVTLEHVIQAAKEGDRLAIELVENAAITLGVKIAFLINVLNPQVVVIGGGVERAGSFLLEPICRTVRRWAFEEPASQADIVPAQLGGAGTALGGVTLVAREVFIQT